MATPATYPRKPRAPDDRELARLATCGDGRAFAELYDRHEQRVYGFCMRMLSNPHDAADATQDTFVRLLSRLPALQGRELNFAAYTLACARNACYDMIESRKRVEPVAQQADQSGGGQLNPRDNDLARDPERAALLAATREDVQAANAKLPARQREVLALREVELLSYDEIGEIMGLNRNAVAQLVSRARIKLRDLLRGSALASVSASSSDCERALPLLASIQDEQHGDPGELDWVGAHLASCNNCRLSHAAMEEAGISYRTLAPIVPLAWLRHAAIARAAEFVGADWSKLAGPAGAGESAEGPAGEQVGGPSEGQAPSRLRPSSKAGSILQAPVERRKLARQALAGAALLTLCILLVATVGITRDGHASLHSAAGEPAAHATSTTVTPAQGSHHQTATSTAGSKQRRTLVTHGSAATSTALATPTSPTPHHSASRKRSGNHRHQTPTTHRPAPTVVTPQPPSATSTTPNPSTPTPPPTTTTPTSTTPTTTEATPAPTPTTTSPSESTGTLSTPSAPPEERPGTLIP
jgi:RNA polymerase sigma factor (sigma-70 family)